MAELDIHPDYGFLSVTLSMTQSCQGALALMHCGSYLDFPRLENKGLGRALGCGKVAFRGQILPTNRKVRYEIDVTRIREGRTVLGIADCQVFVDEQRICVAEHQVGLFTSLDDFA